MKQKIKRLFIASVAFCCTLVFSCAQNAQAQFQEVRLTSGFFGEYSPSLSGDKIVWLDNRHSSETDTEVYLYDFTTKKERRITNVASRKDDVSISGNRIVWTDWRNGNQDIYMYDLATNVEKRITTNTKSQVYPKIDGDKIVWQDYRDGSIGSAVYMYDLATNTEKRLVISEGKHQERPAISGNYVVWSDTTSNPNGLIRLYNIFTGVTTYPLISEKGDPMDFVAISGNKVAYRYNENGTGRYNVYVYDIDTKTEVKVTKNTTTSLRDLAISGNKVAWADNRNGNLDIYLYDLATAKETRITTNAEEQSEPTISGNRLAWKDFRHGGADIFLVDFSPTAVEPPVATPQPVHRFYSEEFQAHFYTISEVEKNHIIATYPPRTWNYEGVAYNAISDSLPGMAPIHRFYSLANKKHFYTISEEEKNHLIGGAYPAAQFTYEGVAWYAHQKNAAATRPLHRFYSEASAVHFYTASEAEKKHIIATYPPHVWNYEGVAWHALR